MFSYLMVITILWALFMYFEKRQVVVGKVRFKREIK
jgi:hypothetical protein